MEDRNPAARRYGGGTLNITGGGEVSSSGSGNIGYYSGSTGQVTVNGTGSTWTHSGNLSVGTWGSGTLNVTGGGLVNVASNLQLHSGGTLNLSGGQVTTGSFYNYTGGTFNFSSGSLTVDGGSFKPPSGEFVLEGIGNPVLNLINGVNVDFADDSVVIGDNADGTLLIGDGSQVTNEFGYIAYENASAGLVTVDGGTWTNTAQLTVGENGNAELVITDGGLVANELCQIGLKTGSTGHVTVSGGTFTNSGQLLVGAFGDGVLLVDDGGSMTSGECVIGHEGQGQVTIDNGTWTSNSIIVVGHASDGSGTLDIVNGGQVSSVHAAIGANDGATGHVTVDGGTWTIDDDFLIGYDTGTLIISNGGQVGSRDASIASGNASVGAVTVRDSGSSWTNTGDLYIGGTGDADAGAGEVTVSGGSLVVGGILKLWSDDTLNITGGSVSVGAIENDGGTLNLISGILTVAEAIHVGVSGDFPSLTVSAGMTVGTEDQLTIGSDGEVTLNGGRLTAPIVDMTSGGSIVGYGVVEGKIVSDAAASITAEGDSLTLGDAGRYSAFIHQGELNVGTASVVLETRGFANLGVLTTLDGGTLAASNGVGLGVGGNITGSGAVNAKVSAAFASTIEATGNLTLGDSSSVAGFVSDGELYVGAHTVTLRDANQAVLGSLTQLGTDIADGTIVADNGLVVEFGKNIIGRGLVDTPNDPLRPLTNNGDIIGDSADAIELAGYVKGAGTLTNVIVSGTLSPGLSPVRMHATNLGIGSEGELVMEIGGLSGGSEYDQLEVSGALQLGGTLRISLMDGFTPDLGDEFDVLDFSDLNGSEFDVLELPELAGRNDWDTSELYSTGEISVIEMLDGDTDGDRDVDGEDYAAFVGVFGAAGDRYTDFNGDGRVDLMDFVILRSNFGVGVESAPEIESVATTPEPATLGMLALGGLAMVRRRKRRMCR
jgi:T5SS/PEP-CTERM-associated repeat protein